MKTLKRNHDACSIAALHRRLGEAVAALRHAAAARDSAGRTVLTNAAHRALARNIDALLLRMYALEGPFIERLHREFDKLDPGTPYCATPDDPGAWERWIDRQKSAEAKP